MAGQACVQRSTRTSHGPPYSPETAVYLSTPIVFDAEALRVKVEGSLPCTRSLPHLAQASLREKASAEGALCPLLTNGSEEGLL